MEHTDTFRFVGGLYAPAFKHANELTENNWSESRSCSPFYVCKLGVTHHSR